MDLHLKRTLQTISSGRKALNKLRQNPDSALESTIPDNDTISWQKAEEKPRKIERRMLQAIVAAGSTPDS